jgi:hypothetical protein
MFAKRAGKGAFLVIANTLESGERVEVLLQGKFRGEDGAAALTDRRVVLANDREWKPDVEIVELRAGLTVQGWQDDRSASLTFQRGASGATLEHISDRELAQRMAALVRSRAGG